MALREILAQLQQAYGKPPPPPTTDPLEMVLWENVAYLVSDEKRDAAFRALVEQVGSEPDEILAAPYEALRQVAELGGIMPDLRVEKLRRIAEIAREYPGGLRALLKRSPAEGRKALKRFPSIGDPGVEKVLLFSKTQPVFALESNGLRVLTRLGYGKEDKSYARTYRSVREATATEIEQDCAAMIRAHQLLRQHGQERCKRSKPLCDGCPVAASCAYHRKQVRRS